MEKARERIFGVVVIASLLIIFGPMLFEATKQHRVEMLKSVPDAPELIEYKRLNADLVEQKEIPEPFSEQTQKLAQQEILDNLPSQAEAVTLRLAEIESKIAVEEPVVTPAPEVTPKISQKIAHKPEPQKPEQVLKIAQKPDLKKLEQKPEKKPEPLLQIARKNEVSPPHTMKPSKGWSIQLGTFASQSNAKELQNKLKNSGYPAYIKTKKSGASSLNVVLVGPKLDKSEAQVLRNNLEKQFKLKGVVIKYEPY
jgi:DedD protein